MGDSEITLARNYAVGAGGRLALDTLALTGAYTTYSLQEGNPMVVVIDQTDLFRPMLRAIERTPATSQHR
jgi:hypothetical protein